MAEPQPKKLSHYFTHSKRKGRPGLPLASVTMNNGLVLREDMDRKMDTSLSAEEHSLVEPGDIAYNMMRMWQGAFGLASVPVNVSPAYVVMRAKPTLDPRFAAHWLKSDRALYLLWAFSYGLTDDRLRLYPKEFLQIPVQWPDFAEQRRIAAVLDTWDDAIANAEKLVAVQSRWRDSLLRKIYAPCVDITRKAVGWEPCTVAKLAKVTGGGTPSTSQSKYWDGDILWCTPTDLSALESRWIENTSRTISQAGLSSSSASVLPSGSVILCSRASVGECAINRAPMATNQGFQSLVPHDGRDTEFLYYMVRAIKKRLVRLSAGSTFVEFGPNHLRTLKISVPPLKHRQEIGQTVAAVDDTIDQERQRLALLRDQKRALMQKLLTERWPVPASIDALLRETSEMLS